MAVRTGKKRIKKNDLFSKIKQEGKLDLTFFFLVTGLVVVGLVMLFSASAPYASNYYKDSYYFISRQLIFAVGGFILMLVVSKIDYHLLKKYSLLITAVALLLLVLVLVLPSKRGDDFRRWLDLGFITFQPSEVAKFALIVLLSALVSANSHRMKELKFQIFLVAIIAGFCGLIVAEHHLSATILVFLIGFVIMFVGGMSMKLAVGSVLLGTGGVALLLSGILPYATKRLEFWFDPWKAPRGEGFQTIQSLLAIGSGGMMGRGIGQSNQKYLWLPEPQNDFIFAVVCEELGFIGAILIVIAFCMLVWRGFIIALRCQDKFGMILCIGLVFQVGLQTILNILVVTNTLPNTGISLPFFSYGGTSLVMLLIQMGIVLSISRSANIEKV